MFHVKIKSLGYERNHYYKRASTRESDDDRDDSISDFPQTICRPVPSHKNDETSGRNLRILIKGRDFSRTGWSGYRVFSLSFSLFFLSSSFLRFSYLAERSKWLVHVVADSENPGKKVTPGIRHIGALWTEHNGNNKCRKNICISAAITRPNFIVAFM